MLHFLMRWRSVSQLTANDLVRTIDYYGVKLDSALAMVSLRSALKDAAVVLGERARRLK